MGFLLIAAALIIGQGVGQMISELTGKSVFADTSRMIGLGIGVLAVVYMMMRKK